jgi:hypothetical protein
VSPHYSNANLAELSSSIEAYIASVDDLYGHYLDSTIGFVAFHDRILENQLRYRATLAQQVDLDAGEFFIGNGNPNEPTSRFLHKTNIGEAKRRNAKGGKNHVRAAQLLIVLIYSFWEHEYRPRLATALGLADANALKIPLFGDIKMLRRDVIHHRGEVTNETATKLSVLAGFSEGKEIVLTDTDVEALIRKIKAAINELALQANHPTP